MNEENKVAEKRRKLLKSVAAGGGAIIAGKTLPENWTRPAVDSVLLPAHAQTSGAFAGAARASLKSDSLFAKALDTLVPQSHAQSQPGEFIFQAPVFDITWCITPSSASTADVFFLLVEENLVFAELWSASDVVIGSSPVPLVYSNGCSTLTGSAGEWMNKLGLVSDAEALSRVAQVTLSGINPGDNFRFEHAGYGINVVEGLAAGACGPSSVGNCKEG